MSWEADLASARLNLRNAELEKQRAVDDMRRGKERREGEFRSQVEAVHRVHEALVRIRWQGAHRWSTGTWRKPDLSVEMDIPEIGWMAGLDGRTPQTASVIYYNRPNSHNALVWVQTGGGGQRDDVLFGDVYFSGIRGDQVTPALVQRAAARWCVQNSIELPLG